METWRHVPQLGSQKKSLNQPSINVFCIESWDLIGLEDLSSPGLCPRNPCLILSYQVDSPPHLWRQYPPSLIKFSHDPIKIIKFKTTYFLGRIPILILISPLFDRNTSIFLWWKTPWSINEKWQMMGDVMATKRLGEVKGGRKVIGRQKTWSRDLSKEPS